MNVTATAGPVVKRMLNATAREDRLCRFTPTPLNAALRVMGRTLTLETNSATVLRHARRAFDPYGVASPEHAEFLWRVVSETDEHATTEWPELNVLAGEGLRLVHFGERCFLAADLDMRQAVGYIPEKLAADEAAFSCFFLAALFQSSASALRLTQVSAACVALGGEGLLLFGPSQCGKTTASYLAAKLGLEFHSDQAAFIEIEAGRVRAWGQFWPAVFRRAAAEFIPERSKALRPLNCQGEALLVPDQHALRHAPAGSVTPVLSIFLERETSEVPRLTPLPTRELLRRLREEGLPGATGRVNPAGDAIARALGSLPAYRLAYGRDPGVAAVFLHSLLKTHNLLEARA